MALNHRFSQTDLDDRNAERQAVRNALSTLADIRDAASFTAATRDDAIKKLAKYLRQTIRGVIGG